ncbi:MAG TPA: AraC family transcriptional regulator, partial [Pseudolabrys sp.]|nr:AraC family transcriptional regulator [Pseudolabrys sp.]
MSPFQLVLTLAVLALPFTVDVASAQPKPGVSDPMPAPMGPASPSPLQAGDAFGEQVTLPERTMVYLKGHSKWDTAFDTLVDAFKSLHEYLDKQNIKPTGPAFTVYTQTDDTG